MNATSTGQDPDALLRRLAAKYAVEVPDNWRLCETAEGAVAETVTLLPGWAVWSQEPSESVLPLLPWRSERRFVELKRLVDDQVVTPVLMARFACHTDGASLDLAAVLYREFDLAEWLLGSPIESVTASMQGSVANVIARLANGAVCGIEASAALPANTAMIDRHELIARRGVACDRVVDTQTPQSSVYALTADGTAEYTDTDAELFGLTPDNVHLVRAAYDALVHSERPDMLRRRHGRLAALVRLALESDRRCERLAAEGVSP